MDNLRPSPERAKRLHSSVDGSKPLRRFLDRLSALDRKLIVSLFWEGKRESEVARTLSHIQPAVNKRRGRILEKLHGWMGVLKKEDIREFR